MKLSELLSELRLNILNDRSDRTSGDSDYLWTDATLVRYINEAQRRFAKRALVIRDATTPEVTQVTLETDVDEYMLHPSILGVVSAKLPDEQNDLIRAGHSVFGRVTALSDNWDLSQLPLQSSGKPVAYSTDEGVLDDDNGTMATVTLRLFPKPSSDYNGTVLRLRVVRMPLEPLVSTNTSAVPEIPEDHHLEMLDWAAYLALRIVDQDAGSPKRAQEFASSFEAHVQAARTVVMRKLFAPQPWGFGKNGWSWGS